MKSDPVEAAIEAMERKPTAAAMRAAFPLLNGLDSLCDKWRKEDDELASARQGLEPEDRINEQQEDAKVNLIRQKQVAEIIDRETGLPELIDACKSMLEWMEFTIPRLNESNTERMNWGGPISKARNAIAKAEGT